MSADLPCSYCGSRRTTLSDSPHAGPWTRLFAELTRLLGHPPARSRNFLICRDCGKVSLLLRQAGAAPAHLRGRQ